MARTHMPEPREITPRRYIDPGDEFLRHAADCAHMARLTRDRQSRATWSRMAERWTECAERFRREREAIHRSPTRYRKPPHGWAAKH
jgi:hypothetical protein